MQRIELDETKIIRGANPLTIFHAAVTKAYPALGITAANSTVKLIQGVGNPDAPDDCVTVVVKNNAPMVEYEFVHKRQNIDFVLKKPVFTAAQLAVAKTKTSADELIDYIASIYNKPFTKDSIWGDVSAIPTTGGTVTPNWRMKAMWNSMFWYGERVVWLHA